MPETTEIRLFEMIFPDASNHYGTLFGGNALALMAKAAFVAATRHAGMPVVMARSERVDFTAPVRVGEMLELAVRITRTGRSSMTVAVEGTATTPGAPAGQPALSGSFEMVAVDTQGKPRPMLPTAVQTAQKRRNA